MNKTEEFDRAMNALLLEVDKSIVENIRRIGHEYAQQVSRGKAKEAYNMARGESPYIDFDDYWTQTQQQ